MREKRQTVKNNLVILCEGTDTEFNYFNEAAAHVMQSFPNRFASIKIVPLSAEKIKQKNPKRSKNKKLQQGDVLPWHYYCKTEVSEEDYDRYKAMPTRFVRETQLYMLEDGYTEGWTVFDKDVHPAHEQAFDLADSVPNLHIAFSSYSFEEWLLVHFERNDHSFSHSECMLDKYHSKECGTDGVSDNCHGTICIAGTLREKKYIPTYSKSIRGLFENYTVPYLVQACVNAAWLRGLNPSLPIYEQNPYTNVDKLAMRLLDKQETYMWCRLNECFSFGGVNLLVRMEERSIVLCNEGSRGCVMGDAIVFYDEMNQKEIPLSLSNQYLDAGAISEEIPIPTDCRLLRIKDGFRILFLELPPISP